VKGIHLYRKPWQIEMESGIELAKISSVLNPVNSLDLFLGWH
jgi:hypothetical protein